MCKLGGSASNKAALTPGHTSELVYRLVILFFNVQWTWLERVQAVLVPVPTDKEPKHT